MTRTNKQSRCLGLTVIFLAVILLTACGSVTSTDPVKKEAKEKAAPRADSVNVVVVKADAVQKDLILPGELAANENAQIRAKVPGYIRTLKVDIGSRVVKGQLLALIDAPEITNHVLEINAKVKTAWARYAASKDYYDRIHTASQSDGVVAPSELQRTHDQMLADQSEYNAALYAAASNRQMGRYLAIVAPYSGIITKRNIDPGSFVGTPGEPPLFELQDNAVLRLRVAVPEAYTGAALAANSATLTSRAYPDQTFKARLVRKAGSIDQATRSEIWEFEVPNPARALKAGSYADVKLHLLRTKPSLVVPSSAIVTTLERRFVIRVSDGHTDWVDVRSGFNMGDKQEVFGQLHLGDTLVAKGTEELKAGTRVIPRPAR